MKRILRMCLLGVIALSGSLATFAQEDKTSLLKNADMEQGLKGWAFDGAQVMGKNTKDINANSSRVGFHGMNMGVQEVWNGNLKGVGDSYVQQRLKELPAGTYVFGAYVGASKQGTQWSNRDSISGVFLFANDSVVPVATDNPDMGYKYKWAHSSKFNVAVTLTDGVSKGYLDVGLRVDNTNANYVVWDNATLYFFGNKSEAEALDAMAEIDMANAKAIADTVAKLHMNADSLVNLQAAIKKVDETTTTAATLWNDSEDLFWAMGLARKSAIDYKNLAKSIENAEKIAGATWRNDAATYLAILEGAIEEAEAAYDKKEVARDEITALRKQLSWYAADLKYDSLMIAQKALLDFITQAKTVENQKDGYTTRQIETLNALNDIVGKYMAAYNEEFENAEKFEDRKIDPNTLLPYIEDIYEAIEEVKSNPFDGEVVWEMVLPQSAAAVNGYYPLDGSVKCDFGYEYVSPLIEFGEGVNVELIRLTVSKVSSNQIYFCLSSLEFFDKEGNEIPLTAADFNSNADHNSVAGFNDGISYQGLVDDDPATWFHSDWSGTVTDPHYLEVVLPNGGYDAVSFKMVSRGEPQRHQFPGEIIVTTPKAQTGLYALSDLLDKAKALNPYSFDAPGYYTGDFSALTAAIAEAEEMLEGDYTDDERATKAEELRDLIIAFNQASDVDKCIRLPEPGKVYRIISAFPNFYENQFVEKAMTIRSNDAYYWEERGAYALYWENVAAGSVMQEFMFEPIMDGDTPGFDVQTIEYEDGSEPDLIPLYWYRIKSVKSGLYVDFDNVSANMPVTLSLVEETEDTIRLKSLGAGVGQWNVIVNGETLHAGDHNRGIPDTDWGFYGGTWGISSGICVFPGGLNSASAWYISELTELPLSVLVEGDEFKSECYHFEAANTLTLTADRECQFTNLALYDLYGRAIEVDTIMQLGTTATIVTPHAIVNCAFALTNAEGVAEIQFNADSIDYTPKTKPLQDVYDRVVTLNPTAGTSVGQYDDITAYTAALAVAEKLLAEGTDDVKEVEAAIKALEDAVKNLKPNLPESGKYYFIYNALEAFEKNKGYKMTLYANVESSSELRWGHENYLDRTRYWQFEPATSEEVKAAVEMYDVWEYDTINTLFFVKNVANEMYIGEGNASMVSDKAEAMPYKVNVLSGTQISLDGLGLSGKRIHANNHGHGTGNGSNIVYWDNGAGTASAWEIVECDDNVYSLYEVIAHSKGNGRVDGGGVYLEGTTVVLSAIPEVGWHFVQWSDGSTANPCIFTLSQDTILNANYAVNIYKVYYYVDGELVHTAEVAYGEVIPEYIHKPTNGGDVFEGWVGETYETMPAHDVSYTASISTEVLQMSTDNSEALGSSKNGQQTIYDLTGRRVERAMKGVYILNGRKVVIR